MSVYAQISDVAKRQPSRTLSGSSRPNTADIQAWIDEAEAEIDGTLLSLGIAAPVTNERGKTVLRSKVCDYAEGRWREALASTGGDGDNDDGELQIERFHDFIDDLSSRASAWEAKLFQGGASSSASSLKGPTSATAPKPSITRGFRG